LHIPLLQRHPVGLYEFLGLFLTALIFSFIAARVVSSYWYVECLLIMMTMLFVFSTLH
jgi:hypothetical protein